MIELNYQLTPATGDKLRDAEYAAEAANVLAMLDGDGMMYTTLGHNMQARLATAAARREARYDQGSCSLSEGPLLSGMKLVIPRMYARLCGESFLLEGSVQGPQTLDFAPLADGAYAVVIETWLALVGPTTMGKSSRPAQYAGVVDTVNKPNQDSLYPAGNLDRAAESGIADDPFVTATVQTQKMLQRQYRVVVIPDRDLAGWNGIGGAVYQADARSAPHGVRCLTAYGKDAYNLAYDRELFAFKLCIVERAGTALRLHVNDDLNPAAYAARGQQPAPIVSTVRRLTSRVQSRLVVVDGRLDSAEGRLNVAEAGMQVTRATNRAAQILQTTTAEASAQRVVFPDEERDQSGWHDPSGLSAVFRPGVDAEIEVHASVAFAQNGAGSRRLALLVDGQVYYASACQAASDMDTELCVSGIIPVTPDSRIEVAAWQSSGAPLALLPGRSRVALRRVR